LEDDVPRWSLAAVAATSSTGALVLEVTETFEILGEIRSIETSAAGRGVYIRRYLQRTYGIGQWRKMKGNAAVRLADGAVGEAEIHWYEAHGYGRRDMKIKRVFL
jgi:hypothetical protein